MISKDSKIKEWRTRFFKLISLFSEQLWNNQQTQYLKQLLCFFSVFVSLFFISIVYSDTFVVRKIQIDGNQRLSKAAVLSYLPIHVGQQLDIGKTAALIKSLFKAGYFEDIRLFRQGSVLLVFVKERPVISQLVITGNKQISESKLEPFLNQLRLRIGEVFRPEKLNEFRQGLIEAYKNMGRYDIDVATVVKRRPYNTVNIHIVIKEGVKTKVHSIQLTGNHVYSGHQLRDQFTLTTSSIFTFLTHHDLYSPIQLQRDLMSLRNFYYDHGYLEFQILSSHVKVSKNRRQVDISLNLYEGPLYHIKGYRITGHLKQASRLHKIVDVIRVGDTFSRKKLFAINKKIADYLANQGYAFPKVNMIPKLNHRRKTVTIIFQIQPGRRFYVRFIHVNGNNRTTAKALRYQLRQLEANLYSLEKVQESKRRIANLPYFKDIQVVTDPVSHSLNQLDLNYHVTETSAGRASVQGGYSSVDGFIYGASVSDPNFMGTAKYASIGFQNSAYSKQYSLAYTNPFYTESGMSRGFSLYYTHTTPSKVNLDAYTMDTYGIDINYSLPLSEYNYLTFAYGFNHVAIGNVNPVIISPAAFQFLQFHRSPYNNFTGSVGITHSTLDRAIFPNNGNLQQLVASVGVPIFRSSLSYYKLNYSGRWYAPVFKYFVLHPHLVLGYGNAYGRFKSLPFFLNYYGGGIGSLPGYEPNTLGTKNPNSPGNAVGGNVEVFGGIDFIFPNGVTNLRTAWFLDFGNVFQTHRVQGNPGRPGGASTIYESIALSNLRWSTGLLVSWRSPFGIISITYGIPFNVKSGDQVQQFGFTLGTSF